MDPCSCGASLGLHTMELAPGALVTDKIRLERLIGKGGMGSVWAADHSGLRCKVAVKLIDMDLMADRPTMAARFQREATAVAQLKSRHIVQVFDHGESLDGVPYIVMELLEGESLHDRLERVGSLTPQVVADIVAQTARALDNAHQRGIVHRDIKPDNIFLMDEDETFVKVLDFGIAKHTQVQTYSVVTATGAMVGTPAYMSPEQILSNKDIDVRSDLWSLGVVTYHMLVGDVPFDGETLGAICVAISAARFKPARELRPDLPYGLDQWMTRALAKAPADRFQSAKEMATAFRDAIDAPTPEHQMARREAGVGGTLVAGLPPKRSVARVLLGIGAVVGLVGIGTAMWMTQSAATTTVESGATAATAAASASVAEVESDSDEERGSEDESEGEADPPSETGAASATASASTSRRTRAVGASTTGTAPVPTPRAIPPAPLPVSTPVPKPQPRTSKNKDRGF